MLLLKRQEGFTLIELVVVIAILGILAAVALPVVTGFLGQSKAQAYNIELKRIQGAVNAYRSNPNNFRFLAQRQYPIMGELKTQGEFIQVDDDNEGNTLEISGNPQGGTRGGNPVWLDDGNGIRDASTEEVLNDEDLIDSPGWQVAPVARQGATYIVDSRDYFINFDKLVLTGLLEDVPASASKDNQPSGSTRTLGGPYSWFVNPEGRVESLLFFFPSEENTKFQDVFPSQRQAGNTQSPEETSEPGA